jgi:1,4-dihydroxy-2-naphthoate octaprenyltransferase
LVTLKQKMARSHHRKKHKEHLRMFKHSHEGNAVAKTQTSKATVVFGILGGLIGLAVAYFATNGIWLWIAVGLIAGTVAGYYIGRNIDTGK